MKTQIQSNKAYSAREAMQFLPGVFKTESEFRQFLRKDMEEANIFNAKVYTTTTLSRFVIRGDDLAKAAKQLSSAA